MSATAAVMPPRPEFGRLYGITHDANTRAAMVRVPRVLKVGIGIPQGKAIQVFLFNDRWHIRHGVWEEKGDRKRLVMKTVFQGGAVVKGVVTPNTKEAAEAWHNANKQNAAVSNRPQKQPFFTFTRRTVVEDATGRPVEYFEPDFDAIAAHGDTPRRIPVILTSESPLRQEDQWWIASGLQCHGDGLVAERAVSAGSAKDEWWQQAKDSGARMFPYLPCRLGRCPHAGVDCKQHSTLELQLSNSLRLGATAYFTSTGGVTADKLHSSLASIRIPLERRGYSIVGVPMELVLGSFRANFAGKPSIQPYVSLELTAAGARALNELLAENSWVPMRIGESPRMLSAAPEEEEQITEGVTYDASAETVAPGIVAEFSDNDAEFEEDAAAPVVDPPAIKAAAATQEKQVNIGEKLKRQREEAIQTTIAPASQMGPVLVVPPPATPPWTDEPGMRAALKVEFERLGDAPFRAHVTKAGLMVGTLKWDDPRTLAVYKAICADDGNLF